MTAIISASQSLLPFFMEESTYKSAYWQLKPEATEIQRQQILTLLKANPSGLTYAQISRLSKIKLSSVCGRIAELKMSRLAFEFGRIKGDCGVAVQLIKAS
ncbi:hypothetical protein HYU06_01560 [Candidatus Woesearchaeota archaeon]|nr:hypothetical protein [Candidatus Woesearchaeota archaeon]